MSNNKVGVLNTNLTIEEFVKDNPQYSYSVEDDVLSDKKGSWAFVFLNEDTGKIHLTAERHVPEDMMVDLLNKYGGEYYESEYDTEPTKKIEPMDILKRYGLDKYRDSSFPYRMLDRMRMDCEYYLGNGNRYAGHLWVSGNEKEHIALMKALWKSLPEDGKPEWLPYDKILEYQGKMTGIEVLFTFGSSKQFPFNMGYVSITAPSVKMAIEEFRRHYPDVNEGILNCADYYYEDKSKAKIFEHGNGAGCHRKIVVESKDISLDERLASATSRSEASGKGEVIKGDFGVDKE